MKQKISVVVPAYNAEKSLERTVDSVLKQTYSNFEILIINDGSTDSTDSIIKKLEKKDSRIRSFNKENGGVSSARNVGIENSTGDYIAFLDSDDYYDPMFLEKVFDPSKDVCFSFYNVKNVDTVTKAKTIHQHLLLPSTPQKLVSKYLARKVLIHTSNWIVSRDVIQGFNLKFEKGLNWSEDILFFSQILLVSENYSCTKEYLTYYVDDSSEPRLSNLNLDRFDYEIQAMDKLKDFMKTIKLSSQQEREIISVIEGYRLPATITYGLLGFPDIPLEARKYLSYLDKISSVNGLRSFKLKLFASKLLKKVGEKSDY